MASRLIYTGMTDERGHTRLQDIIGGEGAMHDTIREHIQAMIKGAIGGNNNGVGGRN